MADQSNLAGGYGVFVARTAYAVTKSDSSVQNAKALYVGGAGDVAVIMRDGPVAGSIFSAVPAGTFMPIEVTKVLSTGTTATLILALA